MAKRKLKIKELRFLIMKDDIKDDGFLKKNYRVHIGRVTSRKDDNPIIACDVVGEIRWTYFFSVFALDKLAFCPTCILNIMHELDDDITGCVRALITPVGNTGVNS